MKRNNDISKIEERICLKASLAGQLLTVAFELTPLCNMNCQMCYIRLTTEEQESEHRLRTVEEWLELGERLRQAGVLFILLTGGEPFLYPGFAKVYLGLKKMGFIITINTNGTLFTDKRADMFAREMPRRVNVTLYGASRETYMRVTGNPAGFDRAIQAVTMLIEKGIPVKLNYSVIRENMEDIPAILDIAEELELPLECNTYMFPCSRRKEHPFLETSRISPEEAAKWEIYIKKRQRKEAFPAIRARVVDAMEQPEEGEPIGRKMRCRAGKSSCWINWKGEMSPCVFLEEPVIDVFSHTLEEAWETIKDVCAEVLLPAECDRCGHRSSCNICAACARWESGDISVKPDYLCRYMDEVGRLLKMDGQNGRE